MKRTIFHLRDGGDVELAYSGYDDPTASLQIRLTMPPDASGYDRSTVIWGWDVWTKPRRLEGWNVYHATVHALEATLAGTVERIGIETDEPAPTDGGF